MTQTLVPAVQVSNLSVHYHTLEVLWDINLELAQGHFVGILGPNGAGKSTFLKAVLGLVVPMSGSIRLFGKRFSDVRKRVAYVPQRETIDWDFPITLRELVLMGRYPHITLFSRPKKEDYEAVDFCLEEVGLQDLAGRQISELSGGQQQRAFLARAMVQDPDIYFLDEPLAGVDHASEELIMAKLSAAVKKNKTVLMVHHDLNSVEKYFSWVIMFHVRLVASGPTSEVFTKHNIRQAYGKNFALFDQTLKQSHVQHGF